MPPVLDAVRRGGASPSPSHPAAERWLQKREATAAQASARQQRREECLRCSTQYGVAAGCKLTISKNGRCIKVGQQTRTNVFWDGVEPPVLDKVNIISVDSDWVRYGQGRNDRFRNVRTAGGFVINATELRSVNFSMQAVDVPLRFTPPRLQPAEACCRLRGARSTRLRSISRSARMGVASKLANKHAQMSSGMVLSHLCLTR